MTAAAVTALAVGFVIGLAVGASWMWRFTARVLADAARDDAKWAQMEEMRRKAKGK